MQLNLKDIQNVLILGAGTLGSRIGLQSALSGFTTVIYDIHEEAFAGAKKVQDAILQHLLEKKIISADEAGPAKNRTPFTTDAAKHSSASAFFN